MTALSRRSLLRHAAILPLVTAGAVSCEPGVAPAADSDDDWLAALPTEPNGRVIAYALYADGRISASGYDWTSGAACVWERIDGGWLRTTLGSDEVTFERDEDLSPS